LVIDELEVPLPATGRSEAESWDPEAFDTCFRGNDEKAST
jgi:hypothetical protein